MKFLFFTLFIFFSISLYANSDIDGHCQAKLRIMDFKSLDIQNCKMAQALVNTPEVIEYQREKIYRKLSINLAKQVEQNIEELATLDQFYSIKQQDLMMDSAEVKKECRIDHIKTLESKCGGSKLNILKSAFNTKGTSLYTYLAGKFTSVRGKSASNQCPVQDSAAVFKLESQLDNKSALKFINFIKNDKDSSIRQYAEWIDQYPQFKLIEKNGDKNFKDLFKSYLRNFSGNPKDATEYITKFFFKNENQKILANGLASQCKKITQNVESFLCNGLDQLGSLDPKASDELFALDLKVNLENNWDLPDVSSPEGKTFYAAYGFQCIARDNLKKHLPPITNSVDQWYNNFNENTRPIKANQKVDNAKSEFCSTYNCSSKELTDLPSCKNGGPISSVDLRIKYKCPDSAECSVDALKYISFIEATEKERPAFLKLVGNSASDNSDNALSGQNKNTPYSTFAENFLGVEGTLIAEGKKVTPLTIAEKSNEFKERKLDPTPPLRDAKNDNKSSMLTSLLPSNDAKSILGEQVADNSIKASVPTRFDQIASNDDNFQSIKKIKPSKTTSMIDKDLNNGSASTNFERDAEIKRLRADLESVTKSIKGSESEKLAAVTDSNARFSPNTLGGTTKIDSFKGLNNSEKDRVDQYQKNLNSWDSRLNNWQNDIVDRNNRSLASSFETNIAKHAENEGSVRTKSDTLVQLSALDKEKGKQAKGVGAASASGGIDSLEAIVSSDDLVNLKLESLKKLGINSKSDFIIKIRYQQKYYNVSVKTFSYKGKDVLVPL
ncbi:MAG: hypothetical protein H7336_15045, partial [Bacteriovorax sp.]|nr:hypothetical protein [Bacteriovorax sp.]